MNVSFYKFHSEYSHIHIKVRESYQRHYFQLHRLSWRATPEDVWLAHWLVEGLEKPWLSSVRQSTPLTSWAVSWSSWDSSKPLATSVTLGRIHRTSPPVLSRSTSIVGLSPVRLVPHELPAHPQACVGVSPPLAVTLPRPTSRRQSPIANTTSRWRCCYSSLSLIPQVLLLRTGYHEIEAASESTIYCHILSTIHGQPDDCQSDNVLPSELLRWLELRFGFGRGNLGLVVRTWYVMNEDARILRNEPKPDSIQKKFLFRRTLSVQRFAIFSVLKHLLQGCGRWSVLGPLLVRGLNLKGTKYSPAQPTAEAHRHGRGNGI